MTHATDSLGGRLLFKAFAKPTWKPRISMCRKANHFLRGFQSTWTPAAANSKKRMMAANSLQVASKNGDEAGARIIETELRQEAEQSYLSYAMSVIVGRALPDARDGLKPVHRRILFAMHELGLQPGKPFRKSARVVGEVLGKFHPHGDTAVYDALVRMAQDFSMRTPLIQGHGNFGSMDDDPPAAMRYTECRLEPFAAAALLSDLGADTVDFAPNFDASTEEPVVLPAKVPNLLVNGSSGIAVGIATKIPPHNMREVVRGLRALIENPETSVQELMQHIPGPDFPTGGELVRAEGLRDAYTNGKGVVLVRAKMHIEDGLKKRPALVITELPYQTNKADLVVQIANLVDEGKITGVSDVRDESDRSGMRVIVELKRGSAPEITMNQVQKHTAVHTRFACNMIALVDGLPRTLNLKEFLSTFLDFRCSVVKRRAEHEHNKASKRLHLVEGFLIAMTNMDNVVSVIRQAVDGDMALRQLQSKYLLTREQAEGVLGLTLRRLTSLEAQKLKDEQATLKVRIDDINDLLVRKQRILEVVLKEAEEIAERYGTDRRTNIIDEAEQDLAVVDLIPNSPGIIVFSRKGYIKRMKLDTFAVQGIRGIGKAGARLKDEDSLEDVVYVNDHDRLLFFTSEGRVHALHAYEVPEAARTAVGTAITQIMRISKPSAVAAMLPISNLRADADIVMCSAFGMVKRAPLGMFAKITRAGVTAMGLQDGDALKFVGFCSPTDSVLMTSSLGVTLHFPVEALGPPQAGRSTRGRKCMKRDDGSLVGMSILPAGVAPEDSDEDEEERARAEEVLVAEDVSLNADNAGPCLFMLTKNGLGKRVTIADFSIAKRRTGKGLISTRLKEGDSVAAAIVVGSSGRNDEELLISTVGGMLLRIPLKKIPILSRYAKGSCVVKLHQGDEVSAVTVIQKQE